MGDLTEWWHGLGPVLRAVIEDGSIILVALLVGWVVGRVAKRLLVSSGIDRYLRLPWVLPEAAPVSKGQRGPQMMLPSAPATALGWFCTASVWLVAAWWIASLHGSGSTVDAMRFALFRGWQAAAVIFTALLASGWLARVVYELFKTPWLKNELDALFANPLGADASFSETAARAVCLIIYIAFLLIVPAAMGAFFNLAPLTGLVNPAWQACTRLLLAVVAFAIGYLGLAWVRSQSARFGKDAQDHANLEYYLSLAIMVATILLALSVLAGVSSGAGAVAMTLFLAFLAFLLWPLKPHVRDLWAGLLLRIQAFKDIQLDGAPAHIETVGPLMSVVSCNGQEITRRNSEILAEALKAPPKL